ncbi:NrdH-redoxin [archaeon]|nr:NrdH-redoxin [archaeon]
MAAKIKIYTTPTCHHCIDAKTFFKEKGLDFENLDVSSDEKAGAEMVEKSGQMGVPVIFINDEMIIGFDKEKVEKLLK